VEQLIIRMASENRDWTYDWISGAMANLRYVISDWTVGVAHPSEAALARACLTEIDKLRDQYGAAEFEPRHPDVGSGRPWPAGEL
jgi:hypothetical protein